MLTVSGLTKRFGGFTALNAVSFEVREGEILGLIGPNGSGKTTCFNCISGALVPTAGAIRFREHDIGGLTPDAICHRGIARTFQIPRPFRKLTILENVAVAAHFGAARRSTESQARQRATEILALVALHAPPDASTASLGAGGLKKLELARALATGGSIPRRWLARPTCSAASAASSASRSSGSSTSWPR
jgi:branched-chain amino acid transport system ATP-binding protein